MRLTTWLSDDIRKSWKWLSVQLGVVIAFAPQIYDNADWMQDLLGDTWFRRVMTLLGVLVVFNSIKKKRR